MDKLSHVLLDMGFYPVLGTIETMPDMTVAMVKRGTPNTGNSKNGVAVVYDEAGRPWIIDTRLFTLDRIEAIDLQFQTFIRTRREEVHVPHSEDGGEFLFKVLPNL